MKTPFQGFRRDARGNVAILVALSLMVLVSIVLGTLEIARTYMVRHAVQAALDAAALTAAQETINRSASVASIETQLANAAQEVLAANLNVSPAAATVSRVQAKYTPPVGFTVPDKIELSVTATIVTGFLKTLGMKPLTVTVRSTTEPPQGAPVELVLVLDVTYSMNSPPSAGGAKKLDTLKDAAKALISQIKVGTAPNIKVGIVPYTSYVNYGLQDGVPDWLLPINRTTNACMEYVYSNPTGQCKPRVFYDCLIDGVMTPNGCYTQDCSDLGTRTCVKWTVFNYFWTGCIGARSVYAYNEASPGLSTSTDAFLDNLNSPTSPKYSGQAANAANPGSNCPNVRMLDLTTDTGALNSAINDLRGLGDTHVPSGLIWGWNMLVPGQPFGSAVPREELERIGGKKVIVLMTDGINSMAPRLYDGVYAGFANGSLNPPKWRQRSTTDDLTARICQNIKNDGNNIQIYTVLFDVKDTIMENILRGCASDPNTMAFTASDRAGLLAAFTDIGNQLRKLKITN